VDESVTSPKYMLGGEEAGEGGNLASHIPVLLLHGRTRTELEAGFRHEQSSCLAARQEIMNVKAQPKHGPHLRAKSLKLFLKGDREGIVEVIDRPGIFRIGQVYGRVAL
jgi:hypothetical protein